VNKFDKLLEYLRARPLNRLMFGDATKGYEDCVKTLKLMEDEVERLYAERLRQGFEQEEKPSYIKRWASRKLKPVCQKKYIKKGVR
jgi:hypothetical protein